MVKNLLLALSFCVSLTLSAYSSATVKEQRHVTGSSPTGSNSAVVFGKRFTTGVSTILAARVLASGTNSNMTSPAAYTHATTESRAATQPAGGNNDDNKLFVNHQINISNVYPNPATSQVEFTYTLSDSRADARIVIRNVLGSVVGEYLLAHEQNTVTISTEHYVAGVYFYTLSVNNKNLVTKKFLVKK